MRTLKKHLVRLSLVLAGCCVALLLAEGSVRIFYPHSRDHVTPGGLIEIDNHLGWRLQAGKSITHHSRYFHVVYNINALGYRDKPRNLSNDGNIYRVLLYGDSQVFGWGVPENQRFSNLMEDQNQSLEIWNLAVPGYGIDQEMLSYEKHGERFNADEVIFFVSNPTRIRARSDRMFKKDKPKFVMDERGSLRIIPIPQGNHVWTSLLYKVLSPLYLPYFVERQFEMIRNTPAQSNTSPNQKIHTANNVGEMMQNTPKRLTATQNKSLHTINDPISELEKRLLDRVRNIAFERNHRMTIIASLPRTVRNALRNFCDQRGIDFLEIVFYDERSNRIFGKHDSHWNAQAHHLVAEQVLPQLKTRIDQ